MLFGESCENRRGEGMSYDPVLSNHRHMGDDPETEALDYLEGEYARLGRDAFWNRYGEQADALGFEEPAAGGGVDVEGLE